MKLIDHHCHILKQYYPDTLNFLKDLKENSNLENVYTMGLDLDTNQEILELKSKFNDNFLKIGLGLHPSEVIKYGKDAIKKFEEFRELILTNKEKIDFIGEIGIDFTYPDSRKFEKEQIEVFKKFYLLADELDLPVSIHCRESWKEIISAIESCDKKLKPREYRGFLHCFTGTFDEGVFCVENGLKLGLNGIITYKKSDELRQTVKEILEFYSDKEFDEIFGLETDSPYLSPEPVRNEENSPKNIKIISEFINKNILDS